MKFFWILLILTIISCKQQNEHIIVSKADSVEFVEQLDNTSNSIKNNTDWEGEYQGIIDCEDCNKPNLQLFLYPDNTYEMITITGSQEDIEQGSFEWNIQENKIRFNNPEQMEFIISNNKIHFIQNNANTTVELQKKN